MKKVFTLVLAAFAALGVSAQYVCTQKGTVLNYERTLTVEGNTETSEIVSTVCEVSTAADGVVTVREQTVSPIPGTVMGKTTEYSVSTYNPADSTTTLIVAGEEDSKQSIVEMIKGQAEAAGAVLSDGQIAEIEGNIKVKGELLLNLSPNMPDGTKFKNQTLTLTLKMPQGSQIIKINLWEAKIAGREKVTVPAGTFDCLKVCYLQRTSAAGNVDKSYVTDWYAEGVGTVRAEVATEKNGEPVAVNVLKSIVRPQ